MLYWGMPPKSGGIFVERMGYHGAAMGRPVHGLGQARGSAEHCALLAVVSACFVPPSAAYFGYIDWNTLALLFSLMVVMKGYQRAGGVSLPGQWALCGRCEAPVPCWGCWCSSPLTEHGGDQRRGVSSPLCPLDCWCFANGRAGAASGAPGGDADLGDQPGQACSPPWATPRTSISTAKSGMGFGGLCLLMLPYVAVAGGCLAVALLLRRPSPVQAPAVPGEVGRPPAPDPLHPGVWPVPAGAVPGGECLGGVCHPCPVFLLLTDRALLASVDYSPAGGCLQRFSFSLGISPGWEGFQSILSGALTGHVELVAVLASQVTSNVPAALLALRLYQPVGLADCGVQPGRVGDADRLHGQPHLL